MFKQFVLLTTITLLLLLALILVQSLAAPTPALAAQSAQRWEYLYVIAYLQSDLSGTFDFEAFGANLPEDLNATLDTFRPKDLIFMLEGHEIVGIDPNAYTGVLNYLGSLGWELVDLRPAEDPIVASATFKRPLS